MSANTVELPVKVLSEMYDREFSYAEACVLVQRVNAVNHHIPYFDTWEGTKCAIHASLDYVSSMKEGCDGVAEAAFGHFKSVAQFGAKHPCVVEPGTRTRDGLFAKYLIGLEYCPNAWRSEKMPGKLVQLEGKRSFSVQEMGQGYCYALAIRSTLRMRLARVIGPGPYVTAFFWAMWIAGRHVLPPWELRFVGKFRRPGEQEESYYHLEEREGLMSHVNFTALLQAIGKLALQDPNARIGAGEKGWQDSDDEGEEQDEHEVCWGWDYVVDSPGTHGATNKAVGNAPEIRYTNFVNKVIKQGHVPKLAVHLADVHGLNSPPSVLLHLVTSTKVELGEDWKDLWKLQQMLAVVGDAQLKEMLMMFLVHEGEMSDYQEALKLQENEALFNSVHRSLLLQYMSPGMQAGSVKTVATCFEGLVCLLSYFNSKSDVAKFCYVIGALPDVVKNVTVRTIQTEPAEVSVKVGRKELKVLEMFREASNSSAEGQDLQAAILGALATILQSEQGKRSGSSE